MAGARSEQLFRTGINYNIPSGATLSIADAPTSANHLARKTDLDAAVAAVRTNATIIVRVAAGAAVDLSSMPANVDSIALSNGDKFLADSQVDQTENGIYVFNGAASAATRDPNYDESDELPAGALITVQDGTYENKAFIVEGSGFLDIGTDNIVVSALTLDTAIADGAVTTAKLAADAVDGTKLADDAVDSEHIADGAIDAVHLAADIVDGTKIADDAIDSEHIAAGAVDAEHLAADIVDGTKIADDAVDSEHLAAGAIDTEHLGDLQVTKDKIALDAIDGTLIADDAVDSEHIAAGAIDAEHLAADIIDGTKIADDAVDSEHIAAGAVGTTEIDDDAVTQAKIAAAVNLLFAELVDIPADGCVNIGSSDGAGLVTYGGAGDTVDVAAGTFVNVAGERFTLGADTGIAIPDADVGSRNWILVHAASGGFGTTKGSAEGGAGLPTEPSLPAGAVLLARVLKKDGAYAASPEGVTEVTGDGDIWDARRALKGKLRTQDLTGDDSTTEFYLSRRLDRVNGLITVEDNIEMLKLVSGAPGAGEFSITDDPEGDGDLVTLGEAHGAADKMRVTYLG